MTKPSRKPWAPPPWSVLVLACILLVLLNVFDAIATFEIVRRGGEEANPIAKPMFDRGEVPFFLWKTGLTAGCAVILALLSRTHRAAWWLFRAAIVGYAAVALLHAYLLWFIKHPP